MKSTHDDVWIVLVNYNGWDDTLRCLESLSRLAVPARVVLVENASRVDRLDEVRERFGWCELIRSPVNGGWAGGNNLGIAHARARGARWVVLLNNDTTVDPRMLEALLAAAARHPDFGILGPVINFMSEPGEVMTDGVRFNRPGFDGFFERQEVPHDGALHETDIVNGCCMMVASRVFDTVGVIDERFFLIHEESDFCLRAQAAGFRNGVLGRPLVLHKGSSTFKATGSRIQRYYDARNLPLLLAKHPRRPGARGRLGSWAQYLRHLHYRHESECEAGSADAAEAVLEGFYDALRRRHGPARAGVRRPGLGLLRAGLGGLRWLRDRLRPPRVQPEAP